MAITLMELDFLYGLTILFFLLAGTSITDSALIGAVIGGPIIVVVAGGFIAFYITKTKKSNKGSHHP